MLQPIFFVMNHSLSLLILLFLISNPKYSFTQEYWQQEVNYRMDVRLDDENHMLDAFQEFEYINHSPDTLNELYIHLWPNAYSNGETALAGQISDFWMAKINEISSPERGYIDSLAFQLDGISVNHSIHNGNVDIAYIKLLTPLLPGDSIIISTPFRVKIPSGSISRLGHIGQSYQIIHFYHKLQA